MKPFSSKNLPRAARVCGLLLAAHAVALAQQYTIATVAGGAPPLTPASALGSSIGPTRRVTTDAAGDLYFTSLNCVFKVDTGGVLTVIAGNSRAGFSGDGGPALHAQLNNPQGIALDPLGDFFIADTGNQRIRKVTPDGNIQTIAGIGVAGFFGNGGPATQAMLNNPGGLAVDGAGNVYIADSGNHAIRRITPDGNINAFAGNSYPGFSGDTGSALSANLQDPQDVAIGPKGIIYIADTDNARIRAVGTDGNINTVVGNGNIGISGDGGPALSASLSTPYSVVVDSSVNIYIADYGNNRIRKVNSSGIIVTVVGNGSFGFSGDGGPATKATLNLPTGVAVDTSGNLYIADQWNLRLRKVVSSGTISSVAGNGQLSYSGDGGSATLAQMNDPQGVAADNSGNFYIADSRNAVVRKVAPGGVITSIPGTSLIYPRGLATDSAGNVYVSDYQDNRVKEIAPDGTVTTVAGNGTPGYSGDGGAATQATLHSPFGVAVDRAGNLYIADFSNNVIREVSAAGIISTVAGTGTQGYSGDGGPATQATLNGPFGVAVDASGNLFIADTNNNVVREVTRDNIIHTVAGNGVRGDSGDGGPALQAEIIAPSGITVDAGSRVYVSDAGMRIRRFLPGSIITTIGGNGVPGYSGDNGAATLASVNDPIGIALDSSSNVYIADSANNAVRVLQPPASAPISLAAVTNAASNALGAIAPGEIVVLWGTGLGPAQLTLFQPPASGTISTNLAGTSILFGGIAAPMIYTSPNQVAAVVPFEVSGASVPVTAVFQNQTAVITGGSVAVAPAAPGLFTLDYSGKGQVVAINQNQQLNSAASPAPRGSQLTVYVTGLGQTSPPGTDGLVATGPPPSASLTVTATVGGQPAPVISAKGAAGAIAGVMEVVMQVPAGVLPGNSISIAVQAGGVSTQLGATVAVN